MHAESYQTTEVVSPLWAKQFFSEGPKGRFEKLILYSDIPENFPLVNVGFGDRIGNSLDFDDRVESKNGDGEKILATVIRTIPEFFIRFPDRILFVQGSTPSRSFVYRKIVRNYRRDFANQYTVMGVNQGAAELFLDNVTYEFLLIVPNYLLHLFK